MPQAQYTTHNRNTSLPPTIVTLLPNTYSAIIGFNPIIAQPPIEALDLNNQRNLPQAPVSTKGAKFLLNIANYNNFLTINQTQANADLDAYTKQLFVLPEKEKEKDKKDDRFYVLSSDSSSDSNETRHLKAREARLKYRLATASRGKQQRRDKPETLDLTNPQGPTFKPRLLRPTRPIVEPLFYSESELEASSDSVSSAQIAKLRRDRFLVRNQRRYTELDKSINRLYSDILDVDILDADLSNADLLDVDLDADSDADLDAEGAQTAISTNQTNRTATLNLATADLGPG